MSRKKKNIFRDSIHLDTRIIYAKSHLTAEWHLVVFSDEKFFSITGPDDINHYRKRKGEKIKNKICDQKLNRTGVMVWAGICKEQKLKLHFFELGRKINSKVYVAEVIEPIVAPFMRANPNYYFQQNNAPAHTSEYTTKRIEELKIPMIEWPAKSPDLNIIENIWAIISRDLYHNKDGYYSISELKEAIQKAYDGLSQEIIKNLYDSIPGRLESVIANQGHNAK